MYSFILSAILISGCFSQGTDLNSQKEVKEEIVNEESHIYKKWQFKIDNKNAEGIGYKIYTDDESIGVKSICIEGEYAYITDVYHTSIKQININTGEIKSSKSLSPLPADNAGIWLRDIAVFNDKIYAPADRDTIYVFSKELNLLQSIPVKNRKKKYIEKINPDGIEIFFDNYESTDSADEITLLFVDKKGEVSTIKKKIPKEEINQNQSQTAIQGKPYKTYIKNGKNYFECEYGTVELENPIPEIREYGASNFNFNASALVYFDSTPNEFTLYVYKYKSGK